MRTNLWIAAAMTAVVFLPAQNVEAAPQILAALPVESGIELSCADGLCAAQLSTYCLQRERPAPSMGTAYVPSHTEHFTLVLSGENGTEVRVPAGEHMVFLENRGFMSVAASIEIGRLKTLGATKARLVVWPGAALIPVAEANDPDPLTADEIAYVTDSLRAHGEDMVDSRTEAHTAQLLAKLNSALPAEGRVSANSFDGMWQHAIGDDVPLPTAGPALDGARKAYDECYGGKATYMIGGLRRCLEFQHDDMIRNLNIDYWQNQPGS